MVERLMLKLKRHAEHFSPGIPRYVQAAAHLSILQADHIVVVGPVNVVRYPGYDRVLVKVLKDILCS